MQKDPPIYWKSIPWSTYIYISIPLIKKATCPWFYAKGTTLRNNRNEVSSLYRQRFSLHSPYTILCFQTNPQLYTKLISCSPLRKTLSQITNQELTNLNYFQQSIRNPHIFMKNSTVASSHLKKISWINERRWSSVANRITFLVLSNPSLAHM
jgi:hypothetical protein